jgi:hypothetical protein
MSHKISCSRCKQQIVGLPNKLGGAVLCDSCYPFIRNPETGKMMWKEGRESSLTFGKPNLSVREDL